MARLSDNQWEEMKNGQKFTILIVNVSINQIITKLIKWIIKVIKMEKIKIKRNWSINNVG